MNMKPEPVGYFFFSGSGKNDPVTQLQRHSTVCPAQNTKKCEKINNFTINKGILINKVSMERVQTLGIFENIFHGGHFFQNGRH